MILELIFLGILGFIFILSPQKAVIVMVALIPFWIEWNFPMIYGIRVGLVDVAVVGGLFGTIIFSVRGKDDQKVLLKGLILSYMIISVLAYLSNPLIRSNDFLKIIWGAYKTIYVTSTFFLFYMVLNSEKLIQKIVNLVLFSSVFCSLFGIIQGITQTPIGFKIGTYGESIIFNEHLGGHLRAFGTFMHSNEFAAFLVCALICTSAVINHFFINVHTDYLICIAR